MGPQTTTFAVTLMLGPAKLENDHPLNGRGPQCYITDNGHSSFIHDSFFEHSHPVWEQKCTA